MKNFVSLLSCAVVAVLLVPGSGGAQGLFGPAEGSRPGQTYQKGEPQPAQQAPQPAPQQIPPSAPTQAYPPPQAAPVPGAPQGAPRQDSAGTPLIMEFSDLQCPDSARFNSGLKRQIIQRYVATGRASYKWHDFPLPSHQRAPEAAAAARCANTAADSMRGMIMDNQADMSPQAYARYARQLGLDTRSFDACLRGGNSARAVQSDVALGKSYGVRGTPTLVLGVSDGRGGFQFSKLVKAYDPPQQVLGEIDAFLASVNAPRQQVPR